MPSSSPVVVSPEVAEIEQHFSRLAHLAGRARIHGALVAGSGIDLDRAASALLRQLASDQEPQRPGVLAARLSVEASHVTRQLGQLEKAGYLVRSPDPADRRAQRVHLTEAGYDAAQRVRAVSRGIIGNALAEWTPEDRRQLAVLFGRMVSDFLERGDAEVPPV